MPAFLRFQCESTQSVDQALGAVFVMVKILGRAWVNSDGRVTGARYRRSVKIRRRWRRKVRTILFGNVDRVLGFFEVGPRHHHLGTPNVEPSLDHIIQVIVVGLLAVVPTSKDGIA